MGDVTSEVVRGELLFGVEAVIFKKLRPLGQLRPILGGEVGLALGASDGVNHQ